MQFVGCCFECISKIELLVVPLNLCMQNIGVSQIEFGLQISGFVASSSGFFGYMRDLRLIRLRLWAPSVHGISSEIQTTKVAAHQDSTDPQGALNSSGLLHITV